MAATTVQDRVIATKEQERKALEKIEKIVADLGEDSYLGAAFEGCFEIARRNIEDDFMCSMKQKADEAQEEAEYFKKLAERNKDEMQQMTDAYTKFLEEQQTIKNAIPCGADLHTMLMILQELEGETENAIDKAADRIVRAADHPELEAFKNAVNDHRQLKTKLDKLGRLSAGVRSLEEVAK